MNKLYLGLLVLGISFFSGCTRYDNPAPVFEEYEQDGVTTIKNKVLIITVDGLVGSQLKSYMPTNMKTMLTNAKYSYKTESDRVTSDPATLVSLVTGVPSAVHGVFTDSYIPPFTSPDPHVQTSFTPSFLYRMEEKNKYISTAVFMRNGTLTGTYLTDADIFAFENSDEQIKTRALNNLSQNNSDLLMLQFSDVQTAAKTGGFVMTNAKYKEALDKVDGYIGEIIEAIDARPKAEFENWLIVVCSPHGGKADGSYGGSSDDELLTFSMYYNKKFEEMELSGDKMESFHANGYLVGTYNHYDGTGRPRVFSEIGVRAQTPEGAASDIFNAATAGEITYEFKIKLRQDTYWAGASFSGGYRNYWNSIMGKDDADGNSAGWHIYGQDMAFALRVQNGSATQSFNFGRGTDGAWNHYAITFKSVSAAVTRGSVYVNGELAGTQDFTMAISAFSNNHPLTFGFLRQGDTRMAFPNADFADVRIWNKELTKEQVVEIACTKWIPNTHPLHNNLIAYYTSFTEDGTWINIVTDKGAPNMTLSNHGEFSSWTNARPTCGSIPGYVYLQNVDLAPQVFYWLEEDINEEWGFKGNLFLNSFENEFKQ